MEITRENVLKRIEDYMRKNYELTPACNLSDDEIINMFRIMQKEDLLI